MQILKFILRCCREPYEYKADWVGTFSSLDDLNVHKDVADDGNLMKMNQKLSPKFSRKY